MRELPTAIVALMALSAPGCGMSLGPAEIVADSGCVVARASPDKVTPGDSLRIIAGYVAQLDFTNGVWEMEAPFLVK